MSSILTELGFDVLLKGNNFIRLLEGLFIAMKISMISVLISIVLGMVIGIAMTLKNPFINVISRIYLEIVRLMPQMVLLFIVYFGSTKALGINISAELSSIIVFSFWGTAEMSDLVRNSLTCIPAIQYESGKALGFSTIQIYIYIIVPQTIRRLIPMAINLITRMIKTTSLIMMIGIVEVLKVGQQIIEANRRSSPNAVFGIYATIFMLYFIACWPISQLSKYLEKKWEN